MRKQHQTIDCLGKGYYSLPSTPRGKLPLDWHANPWRSLHALFLQAREGRFAPLQVIPELCVPENAAVLNRQFMQLLGDAGPEQSFLSIRKELEDPTNPSDFPKLVSYCHALSILGRLSDVPLMVRVYARMAHQEAAENIPFYISSMLEKIPAAITDPGTALSLKAYISLVANRYESLADRYGTDDVLIIGGERYGVVGLARLIRDKLRSRFFSPDLRRRFEGSTGINCSTFYKYGSLQVTQAESIIDTFLKSEDAELYEDGSRYFFGRRIPQYI